MTNICEVIILLGYFFLTNDLIVTDNTNFHFSWVNFVLTSVRTNSDERDVDNSFYTALVTLKHIQIKDNELKIKLSIITTLTQTKRFVSSSLHQIKNAIHSKSNKRNILLNTENYGAIYVERFIGYYGRWKMLSKGRRFKSSWSLRNLPHHLCLLIAFFYSSSVILQNQNYRFFD